MSSCVNSWLTLKSTQTVTGEYADWNHDIILTEILNLFNRQKTKHESDVLRSYLKAAQDDISILLEEKKALLDTIRSMQVCINSFVFGSILCTNTHTLTISLSLCTPLNVVCMLFLPPNTFRICLLCAKLKHFSIRNSTNNNARTKGQLFNARMQFA